MTSTVLVLDCSQRETQLVVARGDRVESRRFLSVGADGHERFYDELRALEATSATHPADLAAVAVAIGPGGFTGLRLSIAFAKAVAFARGIPAIALPSALAVAATAADAGQVGPALVLLAAKHDGAHLTVVRDARMSSRNAENGEVLAGVVLVERCAEHAREGGSVFADAHLDPTIRSALADRGVPVLPTSVEPRALARLAQEALAAGLVIDPKALAPIYPREPEAVTKWRERVPRS